MNTVVSGQRQTLSANLFNGISSQRMFGAGYSEALWNLSPNQVPFLTLLEKLNRVVVPGPDFKWIEDRPSWLTDTTDALHGSAAGTITDVTTANNVGDTKTLIATTGTAQAAGQVWMISDADDLTKFILVYLKSLSTATWTVRILNKPSFQPALSDPITLTSIAYGEGSDIATAKYEGVTTKWGSTQFFKDSVFISNTLKASKDLMYNDPEFQKMRRLEVLKKNINNAITWSSGRYSAATDDPWGAPPTTHIVDNDTVVNASGNPVRFTASLDQCIRMNNAINLSGDRVFDITAGSATYIDDIVAKGEDMFRYVDNDLWGVCGSGFITFINRLALASPSQYNLMQGAEAFGIEVKQLLTPHGKVNLMVDKGMSQDTYRTKRAYLFDPNYVSLAVFREIEQELKETTRSGELWNFEAEIGLKVACPEKHSIIQVN
jgi:hypothetical protein